MDGQPVENTFQAIDEYSGAQLGSCVIFCDDNPALYPARPFQVRLQLEGSPIPDALLGAAVAGMCRKHLSRLVPAFGVSLLFIMPSITGFSMQFSTALCTALIAMIVLLYMPEKRMKALGLWRFFLLAGMATSYVDYLTYPLVTLGWPLCLCLYLWPQENLLEEAKRFAACCGCWAVGYFGMWAGKWVIAGLIGGEQWFWANLLAKIEQRSSSESGGITISYLDVLMRVFRPFIKRTYLLVRHLAWAGL